MVHQVNITDAEAKLSVLVARAEAGERVVLARAGKAVVTLTPIAVEANRKRTPGAWAHLGKLSDQTSFCAPTRSLRRSPASRHRVTSARAEGAHRHPRADLVKAASDRRGVCTVDPAPTGLSLAPTPRRE